MGLMDKVKAQASQLAQQTKDAAEQGKAKLDQAQAGRRGDALLRQLGAAVFAERTGRGSPDSQAKIDQLITDISTHERENGLNLTGDSGSQASVPQQPNFPPDPGQSSGSSSGGGQQTGFPEAGGGSFGNTSFFPGPDSGPAPGAPGFPPES
jgi:hypothetical protein